MKLEWAAVMVLALLVLSPPPAAAASGATTIDYGRSWPRSIVVDSARGLVYIDGMSGIYPPTGFSFGVINASTHQVQKVLPLNVSAGEMAFDQTTGRVFVAGGTSIAVFDAESQSFVGKFEVGHPILDIAYDSVNSHLLFTSGDKVYQVDPLAGRVLREATVGSNAYGVAVDTTTGRAYVTDFLSSSVTVLDSSSLAIVATIALPSPAYPSQIVLNTQKRLAYLCTGLNRVDVVDLSDGEFLQSFTVGPSSSNTTLALALNERENALFVLTSPGNVVSQLDGTSGALQARFSLSSAGYEMAVDQDTGELYVSVYHQVSAYSPEYGGSTFFQGLLVAVSVATALAALWVATARSRRRGREPATVGS